ncbi:MAG: protein kinase, partial [Acidobacteriota bacterium]
MTTVHPLTDGAFVLPPDVLLIPVTDLSEGVREGLSFDEGDIAVTRPNGRASSVILDPSSADLLRSFERPTPIVDAVIALSRDRALDPEETLESAYPVLESLLRSGFLVAEGTAGAAPIEASLDVGDTFEGFEVLEVRQVLEDSEVYRVRGGDGTEGALKLLRKGAERAGPKLRREADILARLDGRASAGLVAAGEADDRPYLVLDWCEGDLVTSVADDLRFEGSRGDLLKLCRNLLAAYVHLHGQGVLHSDVHPRNLLADEDQGIKILDFDYARIPDDDGPLSAAPRGGVAHYFDPEFAGALLRGTQPPPSTPQGEEYALGALLYRLWTGSSYIEMPAEKKALLRGIVGTPPRPFEEVGEDPWGAFERVLGKALEKDPADRHGSIADFLAAFDRATRDPAGPSRQDTRTGRGSRGAAGRDFLKETFGALDPAGGLFTQGFPRGPHASINYGAGGVAFALYRMAQVRGSADLLQWADRWCRRALQLADGPEAFSNDAMSLPADTVGQVS